MVLDITVAGKRQKADALQSSRQSNRWRRIVESSIDWVWESDSNGAFAYLSAGLLKNLGETNVLSSDDNCLELFADSAGKWSGQLGLALAREPFSEVMVSLSHDGCRRRFALSGRPFFDPSGRFLGFRGTARASGVTHRTTWDDKQLQTHLIDAIEHLSHGLAIFDQRDRLVLCNERFRQFFPQVQSPGVGEMGYGDFIRALAEGWLSDPSAISQWIDEHIERHRLGLTHECRSPDGRWFLIRDLRLADGSTVMTGTDITALKQREQALRESEARFRAIFQHAAMGFAVIRIGGWVTQVNQALVTMLGYHPEELTKLRYADLVHPDDLKEESALARKLMDGEVDNYRHETRYLRKDGRPFWGRVSMSLVRGPEMERFGIAMIENIDERIRAEADLLTFRAVAEAAAEAIAVRASNGASVYFNPAHRRLFGEGYGDGEADGYLAYYSAAAKQTIESEVLPALKRGSGWEGILEACSVDGRTFPLWQRVGAIYDDEGEPKFVFAFMHDHSVQQRTEDELSKAKEIAEQANIAKTRFLAAASHDLRQPLQALSMFVTVLSNRNHVPEDTALINRIEDSVEALETLLNGLLDVSKLEAGLVKPNLSAFSAAPLLARMAAEFDPLAAEAGLGFRWVASTMPIQSDQALLERILRNLLNNAIRYTKNGRILLGCRRRGATLHIEVWDTGIGIPREEQSRIFREFHQLDNSVRNRRQGLGLGLAIVDRLAQLLVHPISVSSEPGRGSCFSIAVPLATDAVRVTRPLWPSDNRLPSGEATILVIEDEPDVLESMRLLLDSWGYFVLPAADCEEGLRLLADGRAPDLILADYRLRNGATGAQAINRIRTRLKAATLPAIILTGDTAPERLRQAKASGHGLLHKPVQPGMLRKMIDEALLARK